MCLVVPAAASGNDSDPSGNETVKLPTTADIRKPVPTYKVVAGLDGEVFPFIANHAAMQKPQQREWAVVSVTITNHTDGLLRDRVSVRVPGWSDQEIQIAEMGAGQSRTLKFAPSFLPRLFENREIRGATAEIEVSNSAGRTVHHETVPLKLRSADDMYWGSHFKYAPFIASWVTPHEMKVEKLLSKAKELVPGRRLPGYEPWKNVAAQEKSTYTQARAIYRALQKHGVSYVKSSLTLGQNEGVSQRVRMPRESLGQTSANCIDGAVMYASMFENLGMDPIVVLVPGHAYVGVRVARGSQRYLFVDTALTGRTSFEAAVAAAETGLGKFGASQITRISIDQARTAGIYPMP